MHWFHILSYLFDLLSFYKKHGSSYGQRHRDWGKSLCNRYLFHTFFYMIFWHACRFLRWDQSPHCNSLSDQSLPLSVSYEACDDTDTLRLRCVRKKRGAICKVNSPTGWRLGFQGVQGQCLNQSMQAFAYALWMAYDTVLFQLCLKFRVWHKVKVPLCLFFFF